MRKEEILMEKKRIEMEEIEISEVTAEQDEQNIGILRIAGMQMM